MTSLSVVHREPSSMVLMVGLVVGVRRSPCSFFVWPFLRVGGATAPTALFFFGFARSLSLFSCIPLSSLFFTFSATRV